MSSKAEIREFKEGLYLIELRPEFKGFSQFLGAWLYRYRGWTLLIDPGPASTVSELKDSLKDLGINKVDLILLTHIHLDHAGCVGHLSSAFRDSKILCHPKARQHLIDPARLWKGSKLVLKEIADAYEPPLGVEESRIVTELPSEMEALIIDTPGHAPHHLSFKIGEVLFVGEALGVHLKIHGKRYMRVATPPRFIYETYRDSILRLKALKAEYVAFGHFGISEFKISLFEDAISQIDLWVKVIGENRELIEKGNYSEMINRLLGSDPYLYLYNKMDRDTKEREDFFIKNSMDGIYGYISSKKD